MAQKDIIKQKTKIAKPTTNPNKIVDDFVRIRNNEQSKLRRIEDKLSETRNKSEKAELRKQISRQADVVNKIKREVVRARDYSEQIAEEKRELGKLKAKETRIKYKLDKLYDDNDTDAYAKSSRELQNTQDQIKGRNNRVGKKIYDLNKKAGIAPENIVKQVKMASGFMMKDKGLVKDLGEKLIENLNLKKKKEGKPKKKKVKLNKGDYALEYQDVFWQVWKDFSRTESNNIDKGVYDVITFVIQGTSHSFSPNSLSHIHMTAEDMWSTARFLGSDTIIEKYITIDRKKLKYILE